MADVLVVDNTLLREAATCMRRAWLARWHGYTSLEESMYLSSGRAVHAALADWLVNFDVRRAMAELALSYEEFGADAARVPAGDRLAWPNVRRVMQAWFDGNPRETMAYDAVAVEVAFALPFADGIVAVGRIDADGRMRGSGAAYTVEHKTTGRVDAGWLRTFDNDSQNSMYLWAMGELAGDPIAYVGAIVNAIELSLAPSDEKRKCKVHGVAYVECGAMHPKHAVRPVSRTPEEVASWREDAIGIAHRYWDTVERAPALADIAKVPAEGRFNGSCAYCTLRLFCTSGANVETIDNVLKYEPWEPFEGVRPGTWQAQAQVENALVPF